MSSSGQTQRFDLVRLVDESGVSGTGKIAEGIVFTDGTAVIRWTTDKKSTAIYASMKELLDIHGHGGKTEVRYAMPDKMDDRACGRCGHSIALHIHDGCGWCDLVSCRCTTMEHDDARPLGEQTPGRVRNGWGY